MNLSQLLGPNVDPAFIAAVEKYEEEKGYADYPHADLAYQYSEPYSRGYNQRYKDDQDAREEREAERREFPRSAEIDRKHGF